VNDWKVIPTIAFATVLIFGAGVFTGGMLVDYVKRAHPRMALNHQPPPAAVAATNLVSPPSARPPSPPQVLSKDFLQRLDTEIRLTKDQHEAVQKIIGDGQYQMRKVVQDARLEIREVLTPEQREQFDQLMKRPFHKPLFGTNAPPAIVAPGASNAP
jgi:Spy/CpxP family protein refolding chaperone